MTATHRDTIIEQFTRQAPGFAAAAALADEAPLELMLDAATDAGAVRAQIVASLDDDHLGIRTRRAGGRVEDPYPAAGLSATRVA